MYTRVFNPFSDCFRLFAKYIYKKNICSNCNDIYIYTYKLGKEEYSKAGYTEKVDLKLSKYRADMDNTEFILLLKLFL